MSNESKLLSRARVARALTSSALCVCFFASSVSAADTVKDNVHLVYLHADKDSPHYEALSACDKLTVAEYRKRGVTVTEKSSVDIARWVEEEGKTFGKARENFQRVAFAKSLKADAIGRLTTFEITEEDAKASGFLKPGTIITGWGFGLKSLSQSDMIPGNPGLEPRAVPLRIGGAMADPWDVPTKVKPQACSAGESFMSMMPKRGFLGIQLEDQTITNVVPKSPAELVGLKNGDKLLSVAGASIANTDSLRDVMAGRQPGDEVEIEYSRDGKVTKSKVVLGEINAVMEASRPKVGQPVPDLIGKDLEGRDVKLAQFRGKVVLLDFWATWCGPCVNEAPLVQEVADTLKEKDFVWVAVSADDDEKAWKDFISYNKLTGVHLRSSEWINAMGVQGFPTVMLIDRQGNLQCTSLHSSEIAASALAALAPK